MNAIFIFLSYFLALFGGNPHSMNPNSAEGIRQGQVPSSTTIDIDGVHIINNNPRTVIALEDTHFRPQGK
jgi:hypothetical protein